MSNPLLQPISSPTDPRIRHESIATNGVVLHVAQAGPTEGPLVILLHGFPAFWYDWRFQIPALVAAGYRVWAPDQRGYNSSDKPAQVRSYNLNTLADDVAGLIDAAGADKVYLVGHDWGAAVAWWVAQRHHDRLERVAILNVPWPPILLRRILSDPKQARRSTYAMFFQIPALPELALGARGGQNLADTIKRTARRGTFSNEELAHYRATWRRPGALQAMLNWYRAAARFLPEAQSRRIHVPVHVIWGVQDFALERDMAQESLALCDDGRLTWLAASHWVHLDEPQEVNRLLVEWFAEKQNDKPAATSSSPA